jgi:hypothetical protein
MDERWVSADIYQNSSIDTILHAQRRLVSTYREKFGETPMRARIVYWRKVGRTFSVCCVNSRISASSADADGATLFIEFDDGAPFGRGTKW